MPTTANTISHGRRARTGTVTRIDDSYVGYRRSFRSYARYTITCEDHGTETRRSQYGEALDAARRPDTFCTECAPLAQNRATRRSSAPSRSGEQPLGLERKYGVEFEFFGIRRYVVQSWLDSATELRGWRIKSDCSVSGEGLELISPPLRGQAGLDQIRIALRWLNENGARVNRTCGTHVHHDAADMSIDAIKRFVRGYVNNQRLIDWLVSPSRRTDAFAQYCRGWSEDELAQMESQHGRVYGPTRYKTVNVQSYGRHGTLEVRQHQGTLSFDKTVSWIKFGQAMMDAANARTTALRTAGGIRPLMANLGLDEDAAAYLLGRAVQFGAPTQALMGTAA